MEQSEVVYLSTTNPNTLAKVGRWVEERSLADTAFLKNQVATSTRNWGWEAILTSLPRSSEILSKYTSLGIKI